MTLTEEELRLGIERDEFDNEPLFLLQDVESIVASRERAAAEGIRGEHDGGWFWTQAEWADWSNRLAELVPPEYEDDVAQEAIIERALADLVATRTRIEALAEEAERVAAFKDKGHQIDADYAEAIRAALADRAGEIRNG